jgi:hypothetical protein
MGTPKRWALQESQREQIGGGDDGDGLGAGVGGEFLVALDAAVGGRVLDDEAEVVIGESGGGLLHGIEGADLDAQAVGAGVDDREGLRVDVVRDEERALGALVAAGDGEGHGHSLGGGGGLVEERRAGERQAGEVADHGLEVEQRFEASLGDLGLVGGVLGVPARVLEDVAQDHAWRDAIEVAHAEAGAEDLVLAGHRLELGEEFGFALWVFALAGEGQRLGAADLGGDRRVDEGVE